MSEISELLKQIKNLHIQTKDLVESIESGTYNSKFRGGGIEFSEVREYMPGDDVKRIDWNVSARHNNLFVKEFVEENELNVYLIDFDTSSRLHQRISSKKIMLDRFHRSLKKTYKKRNKTFSESDWNIILSQSPTD